jgi:hypothetical protein
LEGNEGEESIIWKILSAAPTPVENSEIYINNSKFQFIEFLPPKVFETPAKDMATDKVYKRKDNNSPAEYCISSTNDPPYHTTSAIAPYLN